MQLIRQMVTTIEYRLSESDGDYVVLQALFGHYCKSKLDEVANPRLAAILPAA